MTDFRGFSSGLESKLVACLLAPLIAATGYSVFLAAQATHWEKCFEQTAVVLLIAFHVTLAVRFIIAKCLVLPPNKRTSLNLFFFFVTLISFSVSISAALTLWPMRWTFHGCKPKMELLADQVAAGNMPAFPIRVGPFLIDDGYMEENMVSLWLPTLHSTEVREFIRAPYTESRTNFHDSRVVDLGNGWCFREQPQ